MNYHGLLFTVLLTTLTASISLTASAQSSDSLPKIQKQPRDMVKTLATLKQAEQDLQHQNPKIRSSAAKLLGKYQDPQAKTLLIKALDDPNVEVRRASSISLLEKLNLNKIKDLEKLLSKLGDSDLEVRRSIANNLPQIGSKLNTLIRNQAIRKIASQKNSIKNALPIGTRSRHQLNSELYTIVHNAFSDSDAIVRLNMVKFHPMLNFSIDNNLALKILHDQDKQVLLAILPRLVSFQLNRELIKQLLVLANSQDSNFQLQLAVNLLGNPSRDLKSIFDALLKSNHPAIHLSALIYAERYKPQISQEKIEQITTIVLSFTESGRIINNLISRISYLGPGATVVYQACTKHSLPNIRGIAWRSFISRDNNIDKAQLWLSGLSDSDKTVRRNITLRLGAFRGKLSSTQLNEMISSPYPDVRRTAATLLRTQDRQQLPDFAFDLLIDESAEVRITTLIAIAQLRMPGWQRILQRSLKDSDANIQKQAVNSLLSLGQAGYDILHDFAEENTKNANTAYIQQKLDMLKQQKMGNRNEN